MSFTSDTCNVMKGARDGVIAKLRSVQPKILDVYCICHLVNLCLKSAVKSLPLKVDDLLIDIYYHFRNSVNRMTSLHKFAEFCCVQYKCVLKHCQTRWLSLGRAIDRIIDMWDPLLSYFTSHRDVDKPGKVKTIFTLLNKPSTKLWLLFLSNVLPVFDKFNLLFQRSSTSTIHRIRGESWRLLKTALGFFIKPIVIRTNSDDLTNLNLKDPSLHLPDEDVFVGDNTVALFVDLCENEGAELDNIYQGAVTFYQRFISKQLQKFDFESDILDIFSFLDPVKCQQARSDIFDRIYQTLPLSFDTTKVKLEHREFVSDNGINCTSDDAVSFWVSMLIVKSPMGEHKYEKLATLALTLLSIQTSNADCERVFSHVRRIKSEFR